MRMHRLTLTSALTIAVGSPLFAQQPQHQHQPTPASRGDMPAMHCGGGMAMMHGMSGQHEMMMRADSTRGCMMSGMMDMMGPPGPAVILGHKTQLGLSAAQVTRLEALQKGAQPACAEHMRLGMAAMQDANRLLDAAIPDWSAYAAKLKEATAHMAEGHVAMARAAVAAREVLTAAQRQTLKDRAAQMHKQP